MPPSPRSFAPAVPPRSTRRTPRTTTTPSTKQTSGETWRRSATQPPRRDGRARAWRSLVVRTPGRRTTAGRCPLPRRRDPAASTRTGRTVHHDDPWPTERGRAGAWRGSRASAMRSQSRFCRERVDRGSRRAARPIERPADGSGMHCSRSRGRLRTLTPRTAGSSPHGRDTRRSVMTDTVTSWT